MNSRILLALVLAGAGGFAVTVVAAPGSENRVGSKSDSALKKGMTAEAVIAAVGKPKEVRPMESPEGKAEVWTYRRVVRRDTTQVATDVQEIPAFVWISGPLGSYKEATYSIHTVTVYQVTSLLMFNGQVVTAKQWLEREAGTYQ